MRYYGESTLLTEANGGNAVQLLVLSNLSKRSYTVPAIEKECAKRGVSVRVLDMGSFTVKPYRKGSPAFVVDDKSENPVRINAEDTAVICRLGVTRNTNTRSLVQLLEDNNFFVVNSFVSVSVCENKYVTSKMLMDAGVRVPKMALCDGAKRIDQAVESVGGKFPLVLKLLNGSQGVGVFVVDSLASMRSVLQAIWKVNPQVEVLVQEKIETDHDLRIHVLNRRFNAPVPDVTDAEVIGAMRRNKVKKDFRTNYSLGGTVEKVELTDGQRAMAIRAAQAVGCHWCGVDIIVDKNTGLNYVLEVNSSPGTKGLKQATGVNVLGPVLDFVLDKEHWLRSRKVAGFREAVEIPGLGKLVAKFDTGNGAASCSLTYDECDVAEDGKSVRWKLGGKEFTNKVIGHSMAEVGDNIHERPMIELDIVFAGRRYKGVHVSLVNRSKKSTPFLANRKFLMQLGVSVNPMKAFMLSSFDAPYSPRDAKGDAYGGALFEV